MTQEERIARLERALMWTGPTHTVADVMQLVGEHKAKFYTNGDGMIVAEMLQFPRLRAVNFWLIAGELKACLALEDEILEEARGNGCDVAIATGRKGWGRVAAPTGWRPHAYTFWKPLGDKPLWHRGEP